MYKNTWVYDIEVFPNLFTLVARLLDSKEYKKFVVHESRDDSQEIFNWLDERPALIGFNSIDFDGQVLEHIYRSRVITAESIYDFVMTLPLNNKDIDRFTLPYSEWDMTFRPIDLFKINHYDNKRTSLKWLEYSTRWAKIKDLPLSPHSPVSKSKITEILRYNTNDVDVTYDFYYRCKDMVDLRFELASKFRQPRIVNMSDSSLGSYIFEHILTKEYGIKKAQLKKGTRHTEINGSDILLDYISFQSPQFREIHDNFCNRVYEDEDSKYVEGVAGGRYEQTVMFSDMAFVFGSGGLHACWKAGEFEPGDDEMILSIDVASYYPNLAIQNKFYPLHIGSSFSRIYEEVYKTRKSYPKGSALNYAYKIALNSVYGKSNSAFSLFYDLAYLLKIVVNGQLLLAMLAENLAEHGRLLMVNTDGLEIIIKKADEDKVRDLCDQWELLTNLELEYNEYRKMVIRDVNNYLAIDVDNKPKRKGIFEIYYDITEEDGKPHFYDKTPNATIIPKALWNYYINNVSIAETINKENDIYEFCFGIKKRKDFEYWLITAQENGVIDIDKRSERVLRYYISPGGANIYKFWKDDRKNNIQGVNRGQLVSLAMNVRNSEIERIKKIPGTGGQVEVITQFNVNRDYYIKEAQEIADIINVGTRDKAYQKLLKQMENESNI